MLPGLGSPLLLLSVLSLSSGDRAGAALQSVQERAFPDGLIDNSGRACLLFAAWYLGERDAMRFAPRSSQWLAVCRAGSSNLRRWTRLESPERGQGSWTALRTSTCLP